MKGQAGRLSQRRKDEEKEQASKKQSKRLGFLDKYVPQAEFGNSKCSKPKQNDKDEHEDVWPDDDKEDDLNSNNPASNPDGILLY